MVFDIDPAWVASVFLLSIRIGTLFVSLPIFSHVRGAVTIRLLFTLALSFALASGLDLRASHLTLDIGSMVSATLSEIVVGATLAFGVHAAFGAFSIAGKILDIQSGFGIASVFDPVTAADSPLFSTMLNMLAVVMFFTMNAHHALMRGLAYSIAKVPPGTGLENLPIQAVLHQFGLMFSLGVALIAPVMICLFLIDAAFAVMSRVLPQMNVFVVSIPVKIVAALMMFALMIGVIGTSLGRVYGSIFTYWEQVLA